MAHFGVSGSLVRSAYLQPWTRDGLEFKAFSYLLQRFAFLCLGASPLMPVRTFGVFAAAVVVCNYVMVLTLMPCCVVLFEASEDPGKKRCNVDALMPLLAAAGPSGDWCGFSLPGQKRHHGGRVAAARRAATPAP